VRIIVDTNLWISFLISNKLIQIDKVLKTSDATLLVSSESLAELLEVAGRPCFEKYFGPQDLQAVMRIVHLSCEFVSITSSTDLSRDRHDNFLLDLALDGAADYLLTGDKDLLVLGQVGSTRIMSYTEFIELTRD
jgi:putative PIN family toxin of toxin-antitoxin system